MSSLSAQPRRHVLTQDEIYVDEISAAFVKQVKKEFELVVTGFGGSMPHKIETIALAFEFEKQVSIDEARWLLITLQQKLADMVNKHEKIRPFLAEYPFSPTRADITLSFLQNPDENAKNVEFTFLGRNRILYCKKIMDVEYITIYLLNLMKRL